MGCGGLHINNEGKAGGYISDYKPEDIGVLDVN